MKKKPLTELHAFGANGKKNEAHIVIETPQGSRVKYAYNPKHDLFEMHKILPLGTNFPFDFGFFPSTLAQDGDPLDVLLLISAPLFPGALVRGRIIGAIEAEQTEENKTFRNDRLIAVAVNDAEHEKVNELKDLPRHVVDQIEHFFIFYNRMHGRKFRPIGHAESRQALKIIKKAMRRFKKG